MANLREECEDKYARKEEIPPIHHRLDGLETKTQSLEELGDNHEERIKALEALTKGQSEKLDTHDLTLENH